VQVKPSAAVSLGPPLALVNPYPGAGQGERRSTNWNWLKIEEENGSSTHQVQRETRNWSGKQLPMLKGL